MIRDDMTCKVCGSVLSAVNFTCVREKYHVKSNGECHVYLGRARKMSRDYEVAVLWRLDRRGARTRKTIIKTRAPGPVLAIAVARRAIRFEDIPDDAVILDVQIPSKE